MQVIRSDDSDVTTSLAGSGETEFAGRSPELESWGLTSSDVAEAVLYPWLTTPGHCRAAWKSGPPNLQRRGERLWKL
jgi:hypothetical protein